MAQQRTVNNKQPLAIKASVQTNYMPSLRLDNDRYNEQRSLGFEISFLSSGTWVSEIGFHYTRGIHSSVAFSYGVTAAHILLENVSQRFKIGFYAGRIKMNKWGGFPEVGEVMEDKLQEILHPYVEWEWLFSKHVSSFLKGGYRFLRSETNIVTEIISRSDIKIKYTVTDNVGLYGSGFEFSTGISIPIFRSNW